MAQDTILSPTVEEESYKLYSEKKWPELIKYGNQAFRKGYDYFYLRMRVGIAYYERKNYLLAENHFKKALKYSSTDELAMEYLYYCYVFMGREEESRKLSKTFSKELSEKTGTNKLSPIEFIMCEGGTKISDSVAYYNTSQKNNRYYFNAPIYIQLGLNHHIKNRVSLFHALTSYNQQTSGGSVKQLQYYIKGVIPLKNNWSVSPSFHWININYSTEIFPPPPTNYLQPSPPPTPTIVILNSNYYLGSISIQKTFNKFTGSVGTTVSNMYNSTQYIHSGFLSYSILGNSKLIVGCTGYLNTINNHITTYTAVVPFVYIQPFNNFSLKTSYFLNEKTNIIEDNGYIVNNSTDLTTARWSFMANLAINKHIALYGLYQVEYKRATSLNFNYYYNNFVAGIKIIPNTNIK